MMLKLKLIYENAFCSKYLRYAPCPMHYAIFKLMPHAGSAPPPAGRLE